MGHTSNTTHDSRYERCSIAMLDVAQQLGNIPHCSSLLYSFDFDFSMLSSMGERVSIRSGYSQFNIHIQMEMSLCVGVVCLAVTYVKPAERSTDRLHRNYQCVRIKQAYSRFDIFSI